MKDQDIVESIVSKRDPVLIKFKSMQEILTQYGAWFDGYGNLTVYSKYRYPESKEHMAPSYFRYLGKTVELQSGHSYPEWAIEREYQDLFRPNMALRAIASGKLNAEDMVALANKSVLVK